MDLWIFLSFCLLENKETSGPSHEFDHHSKPHNQYFFFASLFCRLLSEDSAEKLLVTLCPLIYGIFQLFFVAPYTF